MKNNKSLFSAKKCVFIRFYFRTTNIVDIISWYNIKIVSELKTGKFRRNKLKSKQKLNLCNVLRVILISRLIHMLYFFRKFNFLVLHFHFIIFVYFGFFSCQIICCIIVLHPKPLFFSVIQSSLICLKNMLCIDVFSYRYFCHVWDSFHIIGLFSCVASWGIDQLDIRLIF